MTEALREWVGQKFSELARDSTLRRDLLKFNGFSKLVNSAIAKGLEAGADRLIVRADAIVGLDKGLPKRLASYPGADLLREEADELRAEAKALRLRGGGGVE